MFSPICGRTKTNAGVSLMARALASSAALGKLISFEKKARTKKTKLVLTNIRPEIYEVFAITKLTKLFKIKDDEADALAVL